MLLDTYSAYEKFVNNNFKLLIGKIFSYEENGKRILILADEKNKNNTDKLYITRSSIFNETTDQDKLIIAIKVNENTISRVSDNHYLEIHEL